MPRYKVGLSANEFRKLADQIHDYRMDLQENVRNSHGVLLRKVLPLQKQIS